MRKIPVVVAVSLAAVALTAPPATALDEVNTAKLRKAVTVAGILEHERALQRIANANGGTRASNTPGYDASAAYVTRKLRAAGYKVRSQPFTYSSFIELEPATLSQVSPTATDYVTAVMEYSSSGDVTGALVPTNDIQIPPGAEPSSSNSGCEPGDFPAASATEPQVALVQRGTCDFAVKAENAENAGYDAVIIFNEGQAGRQELLQGTLGADSDIDIPAVGVDFATGEALYAATQAGPVVVNVVTSTEIDLEAETTNVIATSRTGDPSQAIVVGAHLDSVSDGPGINDNGSGTSTILEVAEQMSKLDIKLKRQVRFAFWGAEESGLIGSEYYVENLTENQLSKIYANLNFDMLGSPNYVRFVYDGDGSDTPAAGPEGSPQLEQMFLDYFESQGLETEPTAFDGRSDYGPFIEAGIPAGGLFSGAEGVKTEEQAAIYGGTAGEPYDPCYHQACDDITNLSSQALFELGDAVAHAVQVMTTSKTGLYPDGSRVGATAKAAAASPDYRGHTAIR